ncbi:MAG: hypothetical protein HXY34_09605 [Candidatus Thorarchaeota archaeon]|nr:hypothetical protein [Candidatus Thorarchaeota archaeon]
MTSVCPCGRSCGSCVYGHLCGGCLEEGCIHVRAERHESVLHRTKCLFCSKKRLEGPCSHGPLVPPKEFELVSPQVLENNVDEWSRLRVDYSDQPEQPDWPLLVPEVSDVTETTSRLGVNLDEGRWSLGTWRAIAWDMTGYLFDRVHGAPWVRKSSPEENNWYYLTKRHAGRIDDLIFVDRLPDQLAMQTPPSGAIAEYLNRLFSCQWSLFADKKPRLWLLTHGHPSYVDWPPAWHWNLGIRMLASLISYVGPAVSDMLLSPEGVWYPDRSGKTDGPIPAPYVFAGDDSRLVFSEYAEMHWSSFPGIIPFVPGADTAQLSWFATQLVDFGYVTLALDALNTIAHENFAGLPEAVQCLRRAGAQHVIVYGPWPLHPPSSFVPLRNVTYIPSAHHMDMTDAPARFWRKQTETQKEGERWQQIPNYRTTPLREIAHRDDLEFCSCPACKAAMTREGSPVSIWRWGHLLQAGLRWQKRSKSAREEAVSESAEETRLWYQGPSYTVFRRCLTYPSESRHVCRDEYFDTIRVAETRMDVVYPDGWTALPEQIRWTGWRGGHEWQSDFPRLGD